jgi:hypothetical protein
MALSRTDPDHDAASSVAVEVDRVVNASGLVGLAGRYVSVGQALAGHRVTLRLDGDLAHVIDDGVLVRTLPAPVPPALRRRLYGVRLASPDQPAPAGPPRVQRRISGRGVTQVAGQRLRIGYAHRHTLVDIDVHETEFHVYDQEGNCWPRSPGPAARRSHGPRARVPATESGRNRGRRRTRCSGG